MEVKASTQKNSLIIYPKNVDPSRLEVVQIPFYLNTTKAVPTGDFRLELGKSRLVSFNIAFVQGLYDSTLKKVYKLQPLRLFKKPYDRSLGSVSCFLTSGEKTEICSVRSEPLLLNEINPFFGVCPFFKSYALASAKIADNQNSALTQLEWKELVLNEMLTALESGFAARVDKNEKTRCILTNSLKKYIDFIFDNFSLAIAPFIVEDTLGAYLYSQEKLDNYLNEVYEKLKTNYEEKLANSSAQTNKDNNSINKIILGSQMSTPIDSSTNCSNSCTEISTKDDYSHIDKIAANSTASTTSGVDNKNTSTGVSLRSSVTNAKSSFNVDFMKLMSMFVPFVMLTDSFSEKKNPLRLGLDVADAVPVSTVSKAKNSSAGKTKKNAITLDFFQAKK